MVTIINVLMEPFVEKDRPEHKFQFLRHGYFCLDSMIVEPLTVLYLTV
ncbi:hypothetical protein [Paenibacillus sp. FJAT-26967]